jgi:serine/threonine protein phosphatase PrpC
MITVKYKVENGGLNEDRILIEQRDKRTLAIVCDGAGNGGRGGLAADLAIGELRRIWQSGFVDWVRALLAVDQLLNRLMKNPVIEASDSP